MKRCTLILTTLILTLFSVYAQRQSDLGEPYAWRLEQPLGGRYRVPMDTLQQNFYQTAQPSAYDISYIDNGNIGGPGESRIFFNREETPNFIFKAPFSHYITTPASYTFYNTRIPMTLLSYLTGGSSENRLDDLKGTLSGNFNKNFGIAANVEYLHSKGYYDHQRTQNVNWQIATNYKRDRYQVDALFNSYSILLQENGGISNDDFILNPDALEASGGTGIDDKSIPVNLYNAINRVKGSDLYLTQRYHIGSYHTKVINDTLEIEEYIPITSLIHTFQYSSNSRAFFDSDSAEINNFFDNTYINNSATNDTTSYWHIENTLGVTLNEGFKSWAKFGVAAYATYDFRRYTQLPSPVNSSFLTTPPAPLLPDEVYPYTATVNSSVFNDHVVWVGGEISKREGALITYNANGKLGLTGTELGSFEVNGDMQTKFPFMKDSLTIRAFGYFKNLEPSRYYQNYISNHYYWNNDFGKIRKFRVGGEVKIPSWNTYLSAGFENLQNYVYFNNEALPTQYSGNVQVFSATLKQHLRYKILNLDLEATYQASSNQDVIPLPALSAYGNFYLEFKIAKVLNSQIGVDCRYFTSYYGETYNPATLSFTTQNQYKVGNYPLMNVYANFKVKMVRFYVMYSHFNRGLFGGNNSFTMQHYPMTPASFQYGISVDFAN